MEGGFPVCCGARPDSPSVEKCGDEPRSPHTLFIISFYARIRDQIICDNPRSRVYAVGHVHRQRPCETRAPPSLSPTRILSTAHKIKSLVLKRQKVSEKPYSIYKSCDIPPTAQRHQWLLFVLNKNNNSMVSRKWHYVGHQQSLFCLLQHCNL